jgi:hypothetical protein
VALTLPHSHWEKAVAHYLSVKWPGREANNASPLVLLRLRTCGATPPQPHITSSLAQRQLHFTSLSKNNNPFSTESHIKDIVLPVQRNQRDALFIQFIKN